MQPTLPIAHCRGCGQPIHPHPYQVCPTCLAVLAKDAVGATHTHAGAISPAQLEALEKIARTIEGFEILERVGVGGMGVVFRARQTRLGRVVAIKMLPSSDDEQLSSRFSREARAMAALSHPHIVTVHDFGITGNHPYLVMEFIEGPNLRQLLATGALQAKAALALVPDLCDALSYAHDQGVVHRDIKPENVLFTRDGRPKIADFGLAKVTGPAGMTAGLTGSRMAMGTPQYMAPEQWESSRDVDHRADIYALGVMIYEMLTHELPLGRFEPPSSHAAIDARMDEVVMRALERDPQRRYQHARDLSSAIKELARHAVEEAVRRPAPATRAAAQARVGTPTPLPTLSPAQVTTGGVPRWVTALFIATLLTVGALLPWFAEPTTMPPDGRLAIDGRTWISSADSTWCLRHLTLQVQGVEIHGLLGAAALAGGLLLWVARSPFSVVASAVGLACYAALVFSARHALVIRHGALGSLGVAGVWTFAIAIEQLRAWWLRSHAIEVRWGVLACGIVVALGVVFTSQSSSSAGTQLRGHTVATLLIVLAITAFAAMRRPQRHQRETSGWRVLFWGLLGLGTMMGLGATLFFVSSRPVRYPNDVPPPVRAESSPLPLQIQLGGADAARVEALAAQVEALIAAGRFEQARAAIDGVSVAEAHRAALAKLAKRVGDAASRHDTAEMLFAEGRGEEALRHLGDANSELGSLIARVVEVDAAMRAAVERQDLPDARKSAELQLKLLPATTPTDARQRGWTYAVRAKEVLDLASMESR